MSVEYNKLNQTVTLIKAAIPNVLPLLEQINIDPCSCYTTTDLAKVFSLYSSTSISRNVLFLPGRANGIPSQHKLWVTQILLVSTINIIHRDLHHIDILWTSYWFTTLITSCWLELIGRKLENRLYALSNTRKYEKPYKFRAYHFCNISGVQWSRASQDIPYKIKYKSLHSALFTIEG